MKGTRCNRQVPFKICSFTRGWNETDNNSDEATPVPIPNTAVKLVRVDGIGAQFGAERVDRCRSHPSLFNWLIYPAMRGFLFYTKTRKPSGASPRGNFVYLTEYPRRIPEIN